MTIFGSMRARRRIDAARRGKATALDLSMLGLTSVPESLGQLSNLTELRLGGNELSGVPESLGQLSNLTILGLSGNRLTRVPESLGQLSNLTFLGLDGNQLTSVPESLGQLSNLTELWLAGNQLTSAPESLGQLSNLTILRLERNWLTNVPESLGQLSNLKDLWLEQNQLTHLPDSLGQLTYLVELRLYGNQLAYLPESLRQLTNLTFLGLSGNQLTSLPEWLGQLTKLDYLGLHSNSLVSLPESLGQLSNLTELQIYENRLASLPESLGQLSKLRELGLNGNRLTTLPESLGQLSNLTELELGGNPDLVSPPPAVVAQGTKAVLEFLRARQDQGSHPQWRSKLILVGQGRAGKTSMLKALSDQPHDPEEPTTHGLQIAELPIRHPTKGDVTMQLAVWDFGGQEIYYATHQFFLTDQSLFVLVWNAQAGWDHGRLRYWLELIGARAPGAPVVLVATHTADRPADLPFDQLRQDFPQTPIVANLAIDNPGRIGIDTLRAAIAEHAATLPLMGQPWPTSWLAATDACRTDERTYTDRNGLAKLFHDAGVAEQHAQQTLARVLHQLGEILYYPDDPDLVDTIVLKPQWLNTRISRILDSRPVAERDGVLTRADVDHEWADIDPHLRDYFLRMMDKFDVSYRTPDARDGAVAIVVERLSWTPPDYQGMWDRLPAGNQIHIRYAITGAIPPGIPTWFIARSHRFTTGKAWRTGTLLRHDDGRHYGLLTTSAERSSVHVTVRGPEPHGFFAILDDGLNVTFARYPGLSISRWIPCGCAAGCPTEYDYAHLNDRLQHRKPTIECRRSYQDVDVMRMLYGLTPPLRDYLATSDVAAVLNRFDRFTTEVMQAFAGQAELLQHEFMRTRTLIAGLYQIRCPSVFTLTAIKPRLPGITRHTLRLYCEQPGAWHPLGGDEGCYAVNELRPWLRTLAPHLKRITTLLSRTAPIAGPLLGIAAPALHEQLRDDIGDMKDLLTTVGDLTPEDVPVPHGRAELDADYRAVANLLDTVDPQQRWGGLSRTTTPEGLILYLCTDHAKRYH